MEINVFELHSIVFTFRWMGNAAMAVIRGVTEPIDVMAIQVRKILS